MLLPMPEVGDLRTSIVSASNYTEFKQRLSSSNCPLCPELCRERTNIVVDRGNPSSRIALIGEAPGREEDLQGRGFVGRSGRLLDRMMAEIGIDTNRDTLVLNVVKCRPPDNRPPTPEEASNCLPYLMAQLRIQRPEFVVLLGATAGKYLLPASMKKLGLTVGQIFTIPQFPGMKFLQCFHPAYILRNPSKRSLMLEHLAKLKAES